ncbi:MAG: alpha/beta fold hydrolase [Candidatus Undinarchaeales archaeon]|jgi:alpha-beta hydrolase superfamily lysophospholipase|nr:alpha/beta fold hydrolase [Candidatus Undinarchaeales archaeon]MDP7493938.1 alpha/beta fold hydrolase [Candidatus Undinarchaeales archaeon]
MYEYAVEEVTVPGYGTDVHGEVWTPDDPNGAGVVLCHGYAGGRSDLYDLAGMLCDEGFKVMVYDERCHGASTAEFDLDGMVDDATTVVGYMRDLLDDGNVGIFGHSMGGYVASRVAASDAPVDALVTWGSPTSLSDAAESYPMGSVVRWLYRIGIHRLLHFPYNRHGIHAADFGELIEKVLDPTQENLRNVAKDISPTPHTIIHGTNDRTVFPRNADAIYEATGGSAEMVWVEDGRHVLSIFFPEADERPPRQVALETAVDRFKRYLLDT